MSKKTIILSLLGVGLMVFALPATASAYNTYVGLKIESVYNPNAPSPTEWCLPCNTTMMIKDGTKIADIASSGTNICPGDTIWSNLINLAGSYNYTIVLTSETPPVQASLTWTFVFTSPPGEPAGPPSYGWFCGETLVDPRGNKEYATVQIGTKCWMKENINIGTMISGGTNQGTNCDSINKYCYDNNADLCTSDGALYQWGQAMCGSTTPGAQGICPDGWHIPTDDEFKTLEMCLGMTQGQADTTGWRGTTQGDQMKKAGLCQGRTPCGTSGFDGLLARSRNTDGSFYPLGTCAYIWSSLESGSNAWRRNLNLGNATVSRSAYDKLYGFSVRCLKD